MLAETETRDLATTHEAPLLRSPFLLGHLGAMSKDPLGLLVRVHRECGEIGRFRLANQVAFSINSPALVRHVLVGNAANYRKNTRGYRKLQVIIGQGLVTSEGALWLRQRRIAQPAFHKQRIAGFADRMVRATLDLTDRWRDEGVDGQVVDVAGAMNRLTLRIAGETLFSTDISGESDVVGRSLAVLLDHFTRMVATPLPYPEYMPLPSNLRFWRAKRDMDRVVNGIIAERRRDGGGHSDLLGMLMEARDEETGEQMSDTQLRDEVVTTLNAGHETTANALTFTLYLLSKHPAIARRLEAEVDAVLGDRTPVFEDVRALPYTLQVLHESMRLYPPVWSLARHPVEDDTLAGCHVPKGSYVFVSQYAVHRNPELWDNPEGFDPDRFGPDREPPDRFAYFPFSRGSRQCIGDRFAEMETVLVLAALVRRYRFALEAGHRLLLEPSVTLRPRGGLRMRVTRR